MSGYEKSPDYGGPAATWRTWVWLAVAAIMMLVWAAIGCAIWRWW